MGICVGKKRNDRYAIIQTQINNTVREQEDIKEQEELANQFQLLNDEEITLKIMTQSQQIIPLDQKGTENPQQIPQTVHKNRKKKKKIQDENYLKQIEYQVSLKSIVLEEEEDQINCQYNITATVEYMSYSHILKFKGVIINHPKKTLSIIPNTFEEAAKHSRFAPFFQNDFYFNINADPFHNTNYFEKLLNVERSITSDKIIRKSPIKRFSHKSSSSVDEFSSPSPQRKKQTQKRIQYISELLEVVQIFDLEAQPRFQQILFALMLRDYLPALKDYFVYIEELIFLFDQQPKIEQPNVYRVAIFYENLDYNLNDLVVYMKHESLKLSSICFLKFAHNLISTFYNCYYHHCYRINFTLSTIFFTRKTKKFKVQPFCRLSTLIPFDGDQLQNLQTVSESKLKFYIRSFKKDLGALCDILLFFILQDKPLKDIQKLRKQQKANQSIDYIEYAEQILNVETDKHILEIIRISFNELEAINIDIVLQDILEISKQLEQFINELELKLEKEKNQPEIPISNPGVMEGSIKSDCSQDEIKEIDNFDLGVQMNSLPEFNKQSKIPQQKSQYKELLYSSLFMNYRFQQNCISYLSNKSDTLHMGYAQILQSFQNVNYNELDYSLQTQHQLKALTETAEQVIQHPIINQDPFHYYVLLSLLALFPDRPFSLILQFQQLIESQQQTKKEHIKPRLKPNHALSGIIEMRKVVILQVFFTENLIIRNHFSQAIHLIQKTITLQQKLHQSNTLLYGYCLYLNGQICAKTMSTISAMLNLEMCKQLYDIFFPNTIIESNKLGIQEEVEAELKSNSHSQLKTKVVQQQVKEVENLAAINQSILEFKLGQIYFQLNDSENALKCFRNALRMRQRRYDQFSDQVLEITIETLKVFSEQEESGAVAKMCHEMSSEMNKKYKQNYVFQTKNVAILQLIMAVIYENNGVLISSMKYYQRAYKTFLASKSSNYVRQLYISDKIKFIIQMIKQIAQQTISLGKQQPNQIGNLKGLISISDILKPFFSNSYYQNQKQNNFINQSIASPIISANGYLKSFELQEASIRYEKVHKIFSKQRIDENYGLVLEKLGLIQIYQKQFEKGVNFFKLAIEIHERYLQFPQRQLNILRINLYLLFYFAYKSDQRKILDQFDVIEKFIEQIYEEVHWNLIPMAASKINKFKVISSKLGSKALHSIQDLINTIDLYYSIKKQLYEKFSDPEQLKEMAFLYAQKKLIQLSQKQRQSWLDRRSQCQIGQLAKVYVIHRKRVLSVNSNEQKKQSLNNTKCGTTQNTTAFEQSNEKGFRNSQSQIDESNIPIPQTNKILIDLRSAEEILEEQAKLEIIQLQNLRRIKQLKYHSQHSETTTQIQQQTNLEFQSQQSIHINNPRKYNNLNFNQMKQILQVERQPSDKEQSSALKGRSFQAPTADQIAKKQQQQTQQRSLLMPLQLKGRQQKSSSQPRVEQQQSFIKLEDESQLQSNQTQNIIHQRRRRTISQQSLSTSKIAKYKINPFEKIIKKQ